MAKTVIKAQNKRTSSSRSSRSWAHKKKSSYKKNKYFNNNNDFLAVASLRVDKLSILLFATLLIARWYCFFIYVYIYFVFRFCVVGVCGFVIFILAFRFCSLVEILWIKTFACISSCEPTKNEKRNINIDRCAELQQR